MDLTNGINSFLRHSGVGVALGLALLSGTMAGCLLVRMTEHHVYLNSDGSGKAILRLHDLRSDGSTDSAVAADVAGLMAAIESGKATSLFNQRTRSLQRRQFTLSNDTLTVEIGYIFASLDAIEGLRVTADILFLVVEPDKEIVRTNGEIESWQESSQRIVWPRDATRLSYAIRERAPRKSVSIARWYREQTQ